MFNFTISFKKHQIKLLKFFLRQIYYKMDESYIAVSCIYLHLKSTNLRQFCLLFIVFVYNLIYLFNYYTLFGFCQKRYPANYT